MARYYDVLLDFGEQGVGNAPDDAPDSLSVNPFAIVAVWRYRFPVTFSRSKGESFSKTPDDAVRLRDKVLVCLEDVSQVHVTHTKANHVSQMQMSLLPGANYLTEIFPGDWSAVWMVNSAAKAQDLIGRIQQGEACNGFTDGLKFFGRITSARKRLMMTPDGKRITTYTFNGAGFTEFDAQLYYEPYLASQSVGAATDWLRKTGVDLSNLIAKKSDNSQGGISITKVLPMFLDAFFGAGVPKNEGFEGGSDTTAGLDNPNAFIVPDEVAKILGIEEGSKSGGKKSWNDVCNVIWGIQKYQLSNDTGGGQITDDHAGAIFAPDGVPANERRMQLSDELLGVFLPSPPQFNGQRTVWSILQQYLNPAINEMYTCLRAGPDGKVYPSLIVRQLPFSSGLLDESYRPKEIKVANRSNATHKEKAAAVQAAGNTQSRQVKLTRYGEVPRWMIHPILIKNVDLGRSDALRFNFIHVYGETGLQSQNKTGYIVRDPPVTDDLDIIRSGLRPYMMTVNCAPADTVNRKAGDWMYILSDILMGQHLTLTGMMETVGIQSPIAPGDNVEFDEHILHIEAVSHSFAIQAATGLKTFGTTLALSHGMKADQLDGGDFALFSGTDLSDLTSQEAGISRDYGVNEVKPRARPVPGENTAPADDRKLDTTGLGDQNTDFNKKVGIG